MPHILIADDSPVERRLYEALIVRNIPGATVVQAADGAQVLAEVMRSDFDLVLTDVQMPNGDGIEVLTQVSQLRPGVPVVVMTGCGSEAIAASTRGGDHHRHPRLARNGSEHQEGRHRRGRCRFRRTRAGAGRAGRGGRGRFIPQWRRPAVLIG